MTVYDSIQDLRNFCLSLDARISQLEADRRQPPTLSPPIECNGWLQSPATGNQLFAMARLSHERGIPLPREYPWISKPAASDWITNAQKCARLEVKAWSPQT